MLQLRRRRRPGADHPQLGGGAVDTVAGMDLIRKLRSIDWLRAAYRTAGQTFLGMFGLSLLGWLSQVAEWAGNTTGDFPSVSPLGKAVVAAMVAASSGVVAALMKVAGSNGPSYTPPPAPPAPPGG